MRRAKAAAASRAAEEEAEEEEKLEKQEVAASSNEKNATVAKEAATLNETKKSDTKLAGSRSKKDSSTQTSLEKANDETEESEEPQEIMMPPRLERTLVSVNDLGLQLAFQGSSDAVGVVSLPPKSTRERRRSDDDGDELQRVELSQVLHSRALKPSAISVSGQKLPVLVGGKNGRVKVFRSYDSSGLDAFALKRLQRKQALPGHRVHQSAVTALTPISANGIYLTGDESGQVRGWRFDKQEAVEMPGAGSAILDLLPYDQKQLILATTENSRAVFWQTRDQDGSDAPLTDPAYAYAEFESMPTIMTQHRETGGIAIGCKSGLVHLWLSEDSRVANSKLQRSKFIASSTSIRGLAFSADGRSLIVADANGQLVRRELAEKNDTKFASLGIKEILGFAASETGDRFSIADGSSTIHHVESGGNHKEIQLDGYQLFDVACDVKGKRITAWGEKLDSPEDGKVLVIWTLGAGSSDPTVCKITGEVAGLAMSNRGDRVAVATKDKIVSSYHCISGEQIESFAVEHMPTCVRFRKDDQRLFVGDAMGNITNYPVRFVFQRQIGNAPVDHLIAIGEERFIAASDTSGVAMFHRDLSKNPLQFRATMPRILAVTLSSDGTSIAASTDDPENSIFTWPIDNEIAWGATLESKVQLSGSSQAHSLCFHDPETLLAGCRDGAIRVWSLTDERELAQFMRHPKAVESLVLTDNGTLLTSVSADQSVRRWLYPETFPKVEDSYRDDDEDDRRVPAIRSIGAASLSRLAFEIPKTEQEVDDPLDSIREQLLTGNIQGDLTGKLFDLFEEDASVKEDVAASFQKLRHLEGRVREVGSDRAVRGIDALVSARREFHQQRRKLTSLARASGATTYADNQPNLLFSTQTQFDFANGTKAVQLSLSPDNYVFAAQVVEQEHSTGSIVSWDFEYSGVQSNRWDNLAFRLSDVVPLPNQAGALTVPDMHLFVPDGSSREIERGSSWAISPRHLFSGTRLLALGNSTLEGEQSSVLQIYDSQDLMKPMARPLAGFSAFDAVVTAIAFANKHEKIAFAVREKNISRVLVADARTLNVQEMQLVDETQHTRPWRVRINHRSSEESEERKSDIDPLTPLGVTALCFSPNDDVLVAHGRYTSSLYRLTSWNLTWKKDGELSTPGLTIPLRPALDPIESKNAPVLVERLNPPIRFVAKTLSPEEQKERGTLTGTSSALVIEDEGHLKVIGARNGKVFREIPLMQSTSRRPTYSITDDGQWWAMGDGSGNVEIGSLISGKVVTLTEDGRPAHSGAVVGVVTSQTNPIFGFPEYAVTIGEENRLKVWDLMSRLKPTRTVH